MDVLAAIFSNNYIRVRALIKQGADLTAVGIAGDTPLMLASRKGRDSIVKLLLEAGVNPDTDVGFPLSAACSNNQLEATKLLLEAGANINRAHPLTGTPLMYAALNNYRDLVLFLLQNGADINATNANGRTALHQAASMGLVAMASCLVQHGADLCATSTIPPPDGDFPARYTPLAHAAHRGRLRMVNYLVGKMKEQGVADHDQGLALCTAASGGHMEVINLLLEHGWDEMQLPKGSSPLLHAISGGQTFVAEFFLDNGADIQATFGTKKQTALHLAASKGDLKILRNLIRRGADLEARTKTKKETPLHAALKAPKCLKAARVLLNAGANIASRRKDGRNILHLAAAVGSVPVLRMALRRGLDPESRTVRGLTALAVAAKSGQLSSINILVRLGADIDTRCNEERTPLHVAATLGQWRVVGVLVEKGANLDLLDSRGYSPLREAETHGRDAIARFLLESGAMNPYTSETP
ncbi:unnamed protein product [Clonostachys rosea]|uniref:Uncharacterized protein n=1 Tax=Bionectria ochroleuca TaxID=29856 RepID=A0ABY6UUM3_BIOOC|nr:unnamed protein product [Clonostachys rosea]